ncbi:Com family DNA-binding transcriptional regulator [Desulfovibrio sp. JC010]|uniref:Com family DNA-binding transcriptional regulator n=1 Tax=Desulfovibrio sp. JC010 TaxID=2593641 RepID=UPI0013D6D918|nr:Com family DNA-binding transcriptional regulator [Desulfovibrio sp. JC010]NDV27703.1 Com family DNA-binding transcriptional regulator [Desulfovibrio sp. JC010]
MKAEIRCGQCDKLLAKGHATDIEIKCPRCGTYNHMRATSTNQQAGELPRRDSNGKKTISSTGTGRNYAPN